MSINVDKMDSKHRNSMQKPKPMMKRRKKNSSTSDLSSGSLSPKKHIPNGYPEDYRSSPETTLSSSFHSTLTDTMNGSLNTSNGHHHLHHHNNHHLHLNGNGALKSPDHLSDLNMMDVVSPSGSTPSTDSQSPSHMADDGHHHYDDSDSTSSVNKSRRQPRTPEDFYLFCQFILEYANYNEMCSQDALRSSTHSPLDSTGSATESTISSAANEESSHAISNGDSLKDDLDGKDELDGSNAMLNDTSSDDVTKTSAIDASSTNEDEDSDIDSDSYNLITCYCGKPYAARPMIECSQCLTWLHLSCAKIKRKNIPDIFICVKCAKKASSPQTLVNKSTEMTTMTMTTTMTSTPTHPKDLQTSSEPKENNRSKKSTTPNATSQTRSDKIENNILQPLNVSATYETGANNLDNIKTTSTVSSIAVKYK